VIHTVIGEKLIRTSGGGTRNPRQLVLSYRIRHQDDLFLGRSIEVSTFGLERTRILEAAEPDLDLMGETISRITIAQPLTKCTDEAERGSSSSEAAYTNIINSLPDPIDGLYRLPTAKIPFSGYLQSCPSFCTPFPGAIVDTMSSTSPKDGGSDAHTEAAPTGL
jgi:hypothetical protein